MGTAHGGTSAPATSGSALWGRGELVEHGVEDAVRERGGAVLQPRPDDAGGVAIGAHRAASRDAGRRRRRGPRAGRASRDGVGIGPSRRGRRASRRPRRAAGRGSGAGPPPRDGRWRGAGSRARAGRDRRPSPGPPPPPARRPGGGGGSAPSGGSGVPRRSRRARGAGTTRRQSGPGRGVAEGPARWSAAPAASHPRRGRCRAGSVRHRVESVARGDGEAREGLLVTALRPSITSSVSMSPPPWRAPGWGLLARMGLSGWRLCPSGSARGRPCLTRHPRSLDWAVDAYVLGSPEHHRARPAAELEALDRRGAGASRPTSPTSSGS